MPINGITIVGSYNYNVTFGVKCLNKKFSTSKQNQVKRSKAVLWKQTPDFKDTCDTYAHYAGHAVNVVSVENFDHFLNSLSEPSQKVSQLLEVLFFVL